MQAALSFLNELKINVVSNKQLTETKAMIQSDKPDLLRHEELLLLSDQKGTH